MSTSAATWVLAPAPGAGVTGVCEGAGCGVVGAGSGRTGSGTVGCGATGWGTTGCGVTGCAGASVDGLVGGCTGWGVFGAGEADAPAFTPVRHSIPSGLLPVGAGATGAGAEDPPTHSTPSGLFVAGAGAAGGGADVGVPPTQFTPRGLLPLGAGATGAGAEDPPTHSTPSGLEAWAKTLAWESAANATRHTHDRTDNPYEVCVIILIRVCSCSGCDRFLAMLRDRARSVRTTWTSVGLR